MKQASAGDPPSQGPHPRPEPRAPSPERMTTMTRPPDVTVELPLDASAPWRARHAVVRPGDLSPDLRDVVVLLVSELVTASVREGPGDRTGGLQLRSWRGPDLIRVELREPGPEWVWDREPADAATDYGRHLVEELADRWGVEHRGDATELWFEIDRHRAA